MEYQIIDNFKEVVNQIIRYYQITNYSVDFINQSIFFMVAIDKSNLTNLIVNLNTLLKSKIYKYKQEYYTFSEILNTEILHFYQDMITAKFEITVFNVELTSYFQMLPLEMLTLITGYLVPPELNNFCTYLQTWGSFCNEGLYKFIYRNRFQQFYNLIIPYIKYDTNSSWANRYSTLLFEEVDSIEELNRRYLNMQSRNSHINFVLMVYNLSKNPTYKLIEYLYRYSLELLKSIVHNLPEYRRTTIKNILISKQRLEVYNNLF